MLSDNKQDFHRLNKQAGIDHQPIVHAVVMTHCGWNRQRANTPDSSTRYFVKKAVEVAQGFSEYDLDEAGRHLLSRTMAGSYFVQKDRSD